MIDIIKFPKDTNAHNLIELILQKELEIGQPIIYRGSNNSDYYFDNGVMLPVSRYGYPKISEGTNNWLFLISSAQFRLDYRYQHSMIYSLTRTDDGPRPAKKHQSIQKFLDITEKWDIMQRMLVRFNSYYNLDIHEYVKNAKYFEALNNCPYDYPINENFFTEIGNLAKVTIPSKRRWFIIQRGPIKMKIQSCYTPVTGQREEKLHFEFILFKQYICRAFEDDIFNIENRDPKLIEKLKLISFIVDHFQIEKRNRKRITKQIVARI